MRPCTRLPASLTPGRLHRGQGPRGALLRLRMRHHVCLGVERAGSPVRADIAQGLDRDPVPERQAREVVPGLRWVGCLRGRPKQRRRHDGTGANQHDEQDEELADVSHPAPPPPRGLERDPAPLRRARRPGPLARDRARSKGRGPRRPPAVPPPAAARR